MHVNFTRGELTSAGIYGDTSQYAENKITLPMEQL